MRIASLLLLAVACATQATLAQSLHPRLIDPGTRSGLPLVVANDNRTPAGTLKAGILDLNLEVVWADFRVETDKRPGLRVTALAESGNAPTIPGPLIRVDSGTHIRAHVRNTLQDSTITVFGLHARPAETPDSLVVAPGATEMVTFEAGEPGTYFYWIRLGAGIPFEDAEREQLAGAFIIDPEGGSPPDRIFVMNIWSDRADTSLIPYGWVEALTINGKSWPFTERPRPAVGDTLRWRIINASLRNHPMHLHGFFYDVTSLGTYLADNVYAREDRRKIVTETMLGQTTMAMEWIPTRPGNWLFHCHLSFHVSPDLRLPGAAEADHEHHHVHMAGLVIGIEVQPGPTDLVSLGPPRHLTVHANEYAADSLYRYGFALDPAFQPDSLHRATPGPLLVLKQFEPTYVTIDNHMTIPTSVHWHGLEIDSWSDGVPGWSASDGQVSPVIEPGEQFTYKLSLMRPGTFTYHSHLNDIDQLTGGLYGPMIVIGPDDTYDPKTDHIAIVGWTVSDVELNGRNSGMEQPVQHATVGETHRIRLIHIAPAGRISARMLKDEKPVPIKALAKDGADLPPHQQVDVDVTPRMGVGETADFTFTPTEPGTYELVVGYPQKNWRQKWVVAAAER